MSLVTTAMTRNLRFTRTGQVWAEFLLSGQPYGLRSSKDKRLVRDLHMALIRALPGESLLLGVCSGTDPAAVVESMLAGVDPAECPAWARECAATLDSLEAIPLGRRLFWLSVPLAPPGSIDRVSAPVRAGLETMKRRLGLPPMVPSAEEVTRWATQAERVQASIPGPFNPEPVTPAQMVWLHQHMVRRGLWLDPDLPPRTAAAATVKSTAALTRVLLDEGGLSDAGSPADASGEEQATPVRGRRSAAAARLAVTRRRFVKVVDADDPDIPPSYQVLSVIADVPEGGLAFPGSEILGRIDECGLEVDFAIRMSVHASGDVAKANARALRNLNDQVHQRDGEASHAGNHLDRLGHDLAEYVAILNAEKLEVEVRPTMIFCVAGATPDIATEQHRALAAWLAAPEYRLGCPLGYQAALWEGMVPGVPTSDKVREFGHITTSRAFASLTPVATTRVGDSKGILTGLNITNGPLQDDVTPNGLTSVVMLDPEGASDRRVSGTLAVAGEMGSGKTSTLMSVAGGIVDRRGQLVVVDRTVKGEWGTWAESVTDSVVISCASPRYSLDPIRIFPPDVASRVMQTFLTPLLNESPTSQTGVLLSDVLNPEYLQENGIDSAGALLAHVKKECALEGAREVGRGLDVFARRDVGQIIFNPALPPLPADTSAVVIHTAGLPLPRREEILHEHLFKQLGVEKLFSRALHALIAAIAHRICYTDTTRLAGFVVSEVHALTLSAEGEQILEEFIRDGRKHRAVALIDSHDPIADFGSETLRGLIPNRLIMRHTDGALAARCLEWIGLDPTDTDLLDLIMKDTSPLLADEVPAHRRGEGLFRDARGNIARIKVLLPHEPERRAAIEAAGNAATRAAREGVA